MKIVVDMDEVLVQFVQRVLDRWNATYDTKYTRDQITGWSMEDILEPKQKGVIDGWCGEKGFFLGMEPMPGAIEGFNYLLSKGHDVVVATSILKNADNCYDDKRKWMKVHFPDWPVKNFFACSRKGFIDGDMLLDDGSHNIRDWLDAGHGGAVVFDAPWNRDPDLMNSCQPHILDRVSGWKELVDSMEEQERILELLRKGSEDVRRLSVRYQRGFHPFPPRGHRRASEMVVDAEHTVVGTGPDKVIKKD